MEEWRKEEDWMRGKKRGETKEKGKEREEKGRRVEVGGKGNKGKMDRKRREGEDNQIIVNLCSHQSLRQRGWGHVDYTPRTTHVCYVPEGVSRVHYKPHSYGKYVFNMQPHTQVRRRGRRKSTWFAHLHLITVATSLHLYIVYW